MRITTTLAALVAAAGSALAQSSASPPSLSCAGVAAPQSPLGGLPRLLYASRGCATHLGWVVEGCSIPAKSSEPRARGRGGEQVAQHSREGSSVFQDGSFALPLALFARL
ncbi:hypothetical protein AAT19DRAFT_11556 [Rhodotorula toruloides]|uniref:Uncharacterized protein n=1 Tax=Rhodotorula toruloides TaxID=5286 RepID=A0A2S9ZVZ7_RHOTO|nr:hypothetical protein AAT19DRAFT_11556 [Rhodotorula toruloides]